MDNILWSVFATIIAAVLIYSARGMFKLSRDMKRDAE